MSWSADFATVEEYREFSITGKAFTPHSLVKYLRVEPIADAGIWLRAKFSFRHTSAYSLEMSDWTYLNERDLRSISPIIDFQEKKKPFYVTFGMSFYRVTDIRVNEDKILEFFLEKADALSFN